MLASLKRPQFSLRMFLIAVALAGIGLAGLVEQYALRPARQRQLALILANWERRDPGLLGEHELLVLARTTSVRRDGLYLRAQVRIEHVYYGPAELVGHTFDIEYPANGEFLRYHYRLPDKQRHAIWLLQSFQHGLLRAEKNSPFAFPLDETAEGYARATRFAETIERLAQLEEPQRIEALKELVRSEVSEIAYWAVMTLRTMRPEGLEPFLRESLAHDPLTLRAQIAIDKALLDMQGQYWRQPPDRRQLLKSWVTSRPGDKEPAGHVYWWLGSLVDRNDQFRLGGTELVELVQAALENEAFVLADRQEFVRLLYHSGRRNPADTASKALLFDLIKSAPEKKLRLFAATLLWDPFFVKDVDYRAEIKELLESVDDPEVAEILRQALHKPL